MPKYKVTIEARKVIDVDQTIEVEAKNSEAARDKAIEMIERDQIRKSAYDEITSGDITNEEVTNVEKIKKE